KLAGASAEFAATAAALKAVFAAAGKPAVATGVWVLTPAISVDLLEAGLLTPATPSPLDALAQQLETVSVIGSILGRPAIMVPPEWIDMGGDEIGVYGAFRRA